MTKELTWNDILDIEMKAKPGAPVTLDYDKVIALLRLYSYKAQCNQQEYQIKKLEATLADALHEVENLKVELENLKARSAVTCE